MRKGFTLIELLTYVAVASVLIGIIAMLFIGSRNLRDKMIYRHESEMKLMRIVDKLSGVAKRAVEVKCEKLSSDAKLLLFLRCSDDPSKIKDSLGTYGFSLAQVSDKTDFYPEAILMLKETSLRLNFINNEAFFEPADIPRDVTYKLKLRLDRKRASSLKGVARVDGWLISLIWFPSKPSENDCLNALSGIGAPYSSTNLECIYELLDEAYRMSSARVEEVVLINQDKLPQKTLRGLSLKVELYKILNQSSPLEKPHLLLKLSWGSEGDRQASVLFEFPIGRDECNIPPKN